MTKITAELFARSDEAMSAVEALERAGFKSGEISLISDRASSPHDKDHRKVVGAALDVAPDEKPDVGTGVGVGAAAGAAVGILTVAGMVTAPVSLPLAVFGWLGTAAATTIWGGTLGGLIAWFTREGVPEELGQRYIDAVNRGEALVVVRVSDDETARLTEATSIMQSHKLAQAA